MKNILKLVLIIALAGALSGCYPTTRRAPKGGAGIDDIMNVAEKIDYFSVSLTLPETYPLRADTLHRFGKRVVLHFPVCGVYYKHGILRRRFFGLR